MTGLAEEPRRAPFLPQWHARSHPVFWGETTAEAELHTHTRKGEGEGEYLYSSSLLLGGRTGIG